MLRQASNIDLQGQNEKHKVKDRQTMKWMRARTWMRPKTWTSMSMLEETRLEEYGQNTTEMSHQVMPIGMTLRRFLDTYHQMRKDVDAK